MTPENNAPLVSPAAGPTNLAQPPDSPPAVPHVPEPLPTAVQQAAALSACAYPAFLGAVAGPSFAGIVHSSGYVAFRDQLLKDAGSPTDPITRMLLEQMALAHLHIGVLHTKAATTDSTDAAKAYLGAAARLQSEFRRLALALKELQSPSRSKSFTVVKQANLAAGDQHVALVDRRRSSSKKKNALSKLRTQVGTTRTGALSDDRAGQKTIKLKKTSCQPEQLAAAPRDQRCRTATTPRRRTAKQTVGKIHRPTD
jgi:hypothetical protein